MVYSGTMIEELFQAVEREERKTAERAVLCEPYDQSTDMGNSSKAEAQTPNLSASTRRDL